MRIRSLWSNSLSARIAAALTLTLVVGATATISYFYLDTRGSYEVVKARALQEQARELVASIRLGPNGAPQVRVSPDWQKVYDRTDSGYYYSVYSKHHRIVAVSPNLVGRSPLPLTDIPSGTASWGELQFLGPEAQPTMSVRLRTGGFVVVARQGPDDEALVESLLEESIEPLFIFVPFALLAMFLIVLITRRTLDPLKAASAEAAKIGPLNLDQRIAAERLPVEIRPLVKAFNDAMDRVAGSYEIERRITANAAHELRTPLTVLSLRLQRARLGKRKIAWDSIDTDIARMSRLVSQLLDLARKEAVRVPADDEVNLARLVREAAAGVVPLAESKVRAIEVVADEPLASRGSADDLRDMFRNLIENALIHGLGTVTVKAKSFRGGTASITVADEGRDLPKEANESLFERFQKGSSTGGGAGLGLSIVRHVARSHGGDVRFVPGDHTVVEIRLPLTA
ncbi:MAG: HAMP domain-containing histidine kinase [Sphingomonas sp.]|nr:HAMP domain-containing histidine kinase [Sphingomonas sp.]